MKMEPIFIPHILLMLIWVIVNINNQSCQEYVRVHYVLLILYIHTCVRLVAFTS